jgi:hypothetical protein
MQDAHNLDGQLSDPIENDVLSGAQASLHCARVPTEVESELARSLDKCCEDIFPPFWQRPLLSNIPKYQIGPVPLPATK